MHYYGSVTSLPAISPMNVRKFLGSALVSTIWLGCLLASSSCRKGKPDTLKDSGPVVVIAPELKNNELGSLPGAVYQSQANSPIHWQPWSKVTMARAKAAHRLVFCVIAMPQQPGFQKVLADLARDQGILDAIHQHYVPVLVDGDASREMGLLTADLCAEIKRGVQLPLFVWMTADGNPVAWIPVSVGEGAGVKDLFNQSHSMVSRMWSDDSAYVLNNSAADNANRRERVAKRKNANVMSEQPAVDVVRSLRQLASLYDSFSRSFDEAGGLFPSGAIELLAVASTHPGLPVDVRTRCLETTRELMVDLVPSAMFDPLDGGVFASRRGGTWALPSFSRDCPGQARAAVAMIQAFRATGDRRVLNKALGLIEFAEKTYVTPDGLFAVGLTEETDPALWLWSVEEVNKLLSPEDAAWWIKANNMKGLGNLPSESDPRREFFRCNSLAISKSVEELAAEQSLPVEVFKPRFEEVRAKLLAARNARLGKISRDENAHAGTTFRMVSAYAAAYGATGEERFREKAVALLKRSREAFGVGPRLRVFSKDAPDSIGAGRAFIYSLALQAVLDVEDITMDGTWLIWAEDLSTTAAELFTAAEFLKECPDEAKIIDLPVTDLVMLFDDSTAGMVSSVECRLAERERPLVKSFSELAIPLPVYAVDRPILHTDLLLATLARHFRVNVVLGANVRPELKLAAERLQPRVIQRRPARPDDQVPDGAVKVILPDGVSRIITAPEDLQQAVLPLLGKS